FVRRIAIPPGWDVRTIDDEKLLACPRRKTAKVSLNDTDSFIAYLERHSATDGYTNPTIWALADYSKGEVSFKAILNDNGPDEDNPEWRDHLAIFAPKFSEEWTRWKAFDGKQFSQVEFAAFLEENVADVSGDGTSSPSGAQMLQMALSFEANQDKRFKSAIRLQSGGINMSFVEQDDAATLETMKMFDRFALGLPVFWGGEAYRIDARLRYRVREGKLSFGYDLIREDKVLEAATKTIIARVKTETEMPIFFGNPFA
ncbi:DUF2303 family protein, partial [Sphingopyxis sp.]|uniref:DUF2303 family protein n=1 Tax=Sphingopyxis sp. TaxID=1908224 RepID=UPI0025D1E4F4